MVLSKSCVPCHIIKQLLITRLPLLEMQDDVVSHVDKNVNKKKIIHDYLQPGKASDNKQPKMLNEYLIGNLKPNKTTVIRSKNPKIRTRNLCKK
jgi:hypothetical protein